jgi:hypothetical protein
MTAAAAVIGAIATQRRFKPYPTRKERLVTAALSLFVIAVGAILKFAVETTVAGIDIGAIGVILMVVGVVGLALGIWMAATGRETPRESA